MHQPIVPTALKRSALFYSDIIVCHSCELVTYIYPSAPGGPTSTSKDWISAAWSGNMPLTFN
jgi:hypothetical protein